MNIETIISTRERLACDLKVALSTMEMSDKVKEIRRQIEENQNACPHFSDKFQWTWVDGHCPYCGKKVNKE